MTPPRISAVEIYTAVEFEVAVLQLTSHSFLMQSHLQMPCKLFVIGLCVYSMCFDTFQTSAMACISNLSILCTSKVCKVMRICERDAMRHSLIAGPSMQGEHVCHLHKEA